MISWALLTYNRAKTVKNALSSNFNNAGMEWKEMCWTDNGSFINERYEIQSVLEDERNQNLTKIFYPKNMGCDIGYNTSIGLCRNEWVLITGCDRKFQDNWLKELYDITIIDPTVKCISIYAAPLDQTPERKRGEPYKLGNYDVAEALPFGARLFHKDLLRKAGYFQEFPGLYGYSDIELGERWLKVCKENGWKSLVHLKSCEHLGSEGNKVYNGFDEHTYYQFKQKEVRDPAKLEFLAKCRTNKYPYFSPY